MTTTFSQETVEALAAGEPAWLRLQRLAALQTFAKLPLPTKRDLEWQRFDLRGLKLDKVSVPMDHSTVAATHTPLASDLAAQGVIFCDMQTAIARHDDLIRDYLGTSIGPNEPRKFAALHAALWKTGTFLYVPSNVRIPHPLEAVHEFSGHAVGGFHGRSS